MERLAGSVSKCLARLITALVTKEGVSLDKLNSTKSQVDLTIALRELQV